jgi:hypothetical protein
MRTEEWKHWLHCAAMHPLALLCLGMYAETLPNQDGAPARIVVPWKYDGMDLRKWFWGEGRLLNSISSSAWTEILSSVFAYEYLR